MKKMIIGAAFLICSLLSAEEQVVFNFTFVPGVNLHREDSKTVLATGLISSNVYSVGGVQFGPLFATTKEEMTGAQFSGLFNKVGSDVSGIQSAGIFNLTNGTVTGVQHAGVFNISDGEFKGVQGAGVFNVSRGESSSGAQFAGVINVSNDMSGLQTAGVINITDQMRGAQFAGVVNYAKKMKGLQVGVINIVTEDSKNAVPIGILNIHKDGIKDITVWMDKDRMLYQGIETGGQNLYTLLYTGTTLKNFKKMKNRVFGSGLGYRINPWIFSIDLVAGAKYQYDGEKWCNKDNWTPEARASFSVNLGPVAAFAGVSGTFKIDEYNDRASFFENGKYLDLSDKVDLYYTYFAGVKLKL